MQAALPQDRAKDKLECQEEIAQGDDHDHLGGIPDRVSGKEKGGRYGIMVALLDL